MKTLYDFDLVVNCSPRSQPGNQAIANAQPSASTGPVRALWRLLSCIRTFPTTAYDLPQMVDYGHENGKVLQSAVPLVNSGKVDVCWNHSTDARDVAGHLEGASWEGAVGNLPSGLNAYLVIDPAYDSKAAHGVRTGIIRNGSIGLSMRCGKSHPDMSDEDFVTKQGREIGGDVVRWVPESISAIRHFALVAAGTGADPFSGSRGANHANVKTRSDRVPDVKDMLLRQAIRDSSQRLFSK